MASLYVATASVPPAVVAKSLQQPGFPQAPTPSAIWQNGMPSLATLLSTQPFSSKLLIFWAHSRWPSSLSSIDNPPPTFPARLSFCTTSLADASNAPDAYKTTRISFPDTTQTEPQFEILTHYLDVNYDEAEVSYGSTSGSGAGAAPEEPWPATFNPFRGKDVD